MKKKIALLLAAVMTFAAAVPMNLFAADTIAALTSVVAVTVAGDTYQDDALSPRLSGTITKANRPDSFKDVTGHDTQFVTDTVNMELDFGTRASSSGNIVSFRITLVNGKWSFLDALAGSPLVTGGLTTYDKPVAVNAAVATTANTGFVVADMPSVTTEQAKAFADYVLRGHTASAATAHVVSGDDIYHVADNTAAVNQKLLYWVNNGSDGTNNTATIDNEFVIYMETETTAVVFFVPNRTSYLSIPMVVTATNKDGIIAKVYDNDTGFVGAVDLPFYKGGSGTTNTMGDQVGRDYVDLGKITIKDKTSGSMQAGAAAGENNNIVLSAPAGYRFVIPTAADFKININGQSYNWGAMATTTTSSYGPAFNPVFTNNLNAENTVTLMLPETGLNFEGNTDPADGPIFQFAYNVINTLTIEGLRLIPMDKWNIEYDKDINISVKSDTLRITDGVIGPVRFVDWLIDITSTVKEIPAGRANQEAGTVVVSEKAANSWWTNRRTEFMLVDADGNELKDVKISSITLTKSGFAAGVTGDIDKQVYFPWIDNTGVRSFMRVAQQGAGDNDLGAVSAAGENHIRFYDDANGFLLAEADRRGAEQVKVTAVFKLSTDVNFEGEVWVVAKSATYGINGEDIKDGGMVKIADVVKQVSASALSTSVEIGVQKVDVKDVTVTEEVIGGFIANANNSAVINLMIGEFGMAGTITGGLDFVPFGGKNFGGVKTPTFVDGTVDKNFILGTPTSDRFQAIIIPVRQATKTDKAIVTAVNLSVQSDRNIPEGYYDLIVDGTAIRNTQNGTAIAKGTSLVASRAAADLVPAQVHFAADFFTNGIVIDDYIHVATAQANASKKIEVIVTEGSTQVIQDGKVMATEMLVPAKLVENASGAGSFFVPLRFASDALGATNVFWNGVEQCATIVFPNVTVQFVVGSNQYYVVGEAFPRMNADGAKTLYETVDGIGGVVSVPFRTLGYALNMEVGSGYNEDGVLYGVFNPVNSMDNVISE